MIPVWLSANPAVFFDPPNARVRNTYNLAKPWEKGE
jgi:hypothetical protein